MLRDQLTGALKEALKARDTCAVSTVRLILAALKDREIAARGKGGDSSVDDDEIRALLQTMIKQRRESIEMYEKGARPDLAEGEAREIGVIERFLPVQMDEAAMAAAVDDAIRETGAAGLKDMGKVMQALRERHPGAMDFSRAGALARAALT